MTFKLPDLPYAYDALQPYMSAETLQFHHDKHHQAYVDNGNKLIVGSGLEGKSIEEMLLLSESEYAPHGGCFPLIVKNTGIVGTLTVSGLPQEEDHKVAVHAIRTYLENL
mgnify:CR=1 FL=1